MLDRTYSPPNDQLPLRVKGLGYRSGGKDLISNLDIDITSNDITIIMGPNGAGKSLLVRLLHALIPADTGSIMWAGHACGPATRAVQAMVFQKPVLLRRSVAGNIDFVLKLAGRTDPVHRDELLQQANLLSRASQPARALSGGEQQRLAIVRALATEPKVLFLDEPTASLDPASTQAIEALIDSTAQRGVKIIMVTHDIGQARRLANDVAFVHRGKVIEHSSAEAFFTQPASSAARDFLAGKIVI